MNHDNDVEQNRNERQRRNENKDIISVQFNRRRHMIWLSDASKSGASCRKVHVCQGLQTLQTCDLRRWPRWPRTIFCGHMSGLGAFVVFWEFQWLRVVDIFRVNDPHGLHWIEAFSSKNSTTLWTKPRWSQLVSVPTILLVDPAPGGMVEALVLHFRGIHWDSSHWSFTSSSEYYGVRCRLVKGMLYINLETQHLYVCVHVCM